MGTILDGIEALRNEALQFEKEKSQEQFKNILLLAPGKDTPWHEKDNSIEMEFEKLKEARERKEKEETNGSSPFAGLSGSGLGSSYGNSYGNSYGLGSSSTDIYQNSMLNIAKSAYSGIDNKEKKVEADMGKTFWGKLINNADFKGLLLVAGVAFTKGILWYLYRRAGKNGFDFIGKI